MKHHIHWFSLYFSSTFEKSGMKFIFSGMLCFCLISVFGLSAQTYVPPRPLSDHNLIKSFLSTHLVYPTEEYGQKTKGTVTLSFLIKSDGNIKKINVKEGITESLNNEAIRLLRKIIWLPASLNGVAVDAEHEFSVKFDPRKYEKVRHKNLLQPACHLPASADTSSVIYSFSKIETSPEPVIEGGIRNLASYMKENLRYPEAAYRLNLSGIVTLGFVVEPDSSITNIHVIKAVGGGCEQEAIRIVQEICWKPATINSMAVRSIYTFDIRFSLDNNNRTNHIPNRQSSGI